MISEHDNYHKQNAVCEEKFKNIDKNLEKNSEQIAELVKEMSVVKLSGSDPLKKHLDSEVDTHKDIDEKLVKLDSSINIHEKNIGHLNDKANNTLDKIQRITENLQATTGLINNISEQMTSVTKQVQKRDEIKNAIFISVVSAIIIAFILFFVNSTINKALNDKVIDLNSGADIKIEQKHLSREPKN